MTEAIREVAQLWGIRELEPLSGATCSEVVAGRDPSGQEVVIKIPEDRAEERDSIGALREFELCGGVPILDYEPTTRSILMPRLRPGMTLADAAMSDGEALAVCSELIVDLRRARLVPGLGLRQFYGDLSSMPDTPLVRDALAVFEKLEATAPSPTLLHGDLHHFNILRHGNRWVVIDPKGLIGDPSFEITAFMRNPLVPHSADQSRMRLIAFHERLGDPLDRLWGWSFVQTVLSAGWTSPGGICTHWAETAAGLWSLSKDFELL